MGREREREEDTYGSFRMRLPACRKLGQVINSNEKMSSEDRRCGILLKFSIKEKSIPHQNDRTDSTFSLLTARSRFPIRTTEMIPHSLSSQQNGFGRNDFLVYRNSKLHGIHDNAPPTLHHTKITWHS